MVNFYESPFDYSQSLSPYDTFATQPAAQMPGVSDMDYMLSPLDQYRRTQAARMGSPYFSMTPMARAAAERRFEPLYGLYQAAEPSGQYAAFSDFLRERPNITAGNITAAAQNVAGLTAAANPIQYSLYYGGEGVSPEAALDRQQRLARTQMLTAMGASTGEGMTNRAMFNPTLQRAARGAVNQMYQNYLAGGPTGGDAFSREGPTGFMNYYLSQRGLGPQNA